MYAYKTSIGITRNISSQWEIYNVENVMLYEVYSRYATIYIVAHDTFKDKDINIDMNEYRTTYATSSMTVKEWLIMMTNTPMKTVDELPNTALVSARYANAVLHGYKLELAKAGIPFPTNMPTTELTDLAVTRPFKETSLELVHKHCVMSVNGYFHRTDYADGNLFILGGGTTAAMTRCSHTGILSFMDMGEIEQVQLTDENINPLTEDGKLSNGIILNLDIDMTDKSAVFILGGYMIRPEENVFFPNDDNSWVLNLRGTPYLERIMESDPQIDLSSLNLGHLDTNPHDAYTTESLYSDEVIRAYLKLSQTFMVIVDTPALFYNKINVRVSNLPGLITAYQDPVYPLIMGDGKHVEYSKVQEAGYWALRVSDAWYRKYAWQTYPTRGVPVITNQVRTWKPYERTQGYFLEILGSKAK